MAHPPHIAAVLNDCSEQERRMIEEQLEALSPAAQLAVDMLYADASALLDPEGKWQKDPNPRS